MKRSNLAAAAILVGQGAQARRVRRCGSQSAHQVAVAEKISVLCTEEYFAARARRANPGKIARILKRLGKGNAPVQGDELPPELEAKRKKRKEKNEQKEYGIEH